MRLDKNVRLLHSPLPEIRLLMNGEAIVFPSLSLFGFFLFSKYWGRSAPFHFQTSIPDFIVMLNDWIS